MKSLKDYVSILEGSAHVEDDKEQLKDDETCAKEAEGVDPEDIDIEVETDEVEESLSTESLTLESAVVAYGIIDASCCEAYVMNPTETSFENLSATMEASAKELWEKIKAFFKKLWNKIVGWFNKVKMYVLSVFMNGEKFINKYKSEIESKLSTLSSRELKYDGYKFTDYPSTKAVELGDSAKKLKDAFDKLIDTLKKDDKNNDEVKKISKELQDSINDLKNDPKMNLDKQKEEFIDNAYGQKTIFVINSKIMKEEIKFVVSGKAKALKQVNDSFSTVTNNIRDIESKVKKLETGDDTKGKNFSAIFSATSQIISIINTMSTQQVKLTTKYCKDRVSQAVALSRKVLGGSAAAKESFEYNGSGSVLESVMNII